MLLILTKEISLSFSLAISLCGYLKYWVVIDNIGKQKQCVCGLQTFEYAR